MRETARVLGRRAANAVLWVSSGLGALTLPTYLYSLVVVVSLPSTNRGAALYLAAHTLVMVGVFVGSSGAPTGLRIRYTLAAGFAAVLVAVLVEATVL